ncbi:TRAP transporter small permease subunit [Marinobacter sp. NP-4(2019)]|uniref:TRAP transporter small permease subunit n=1 Tax=Marinobacter sp. NP-4(2019) TaxID=2488665 RepID=UPI000FC3E1D2|nr:TRAP transporter small permease subunit [Marinobacter sp. NP-4(2019)]AZT82584.1 TRAP transporter small permease subunit [Marinobacter sp. NP-4(2019)]
MAVLFAYCRSITAVNRWIAVAVSLLVFVMVAVITYEVVARYFFDAPTVWAMELSTLLFGPYFLLAGPYLLHTAGHVNVDILYSRLPGRVADILDCFTHTLIAVVAGVFIYYSLPVAMNAYDSGETSFTAWNPAIWPVKALIPVAFSLLLLQALAEAIQAACRGFSREVSA